MGKDGLSGEERMAEQRQKMAGRDKWLYSIFSLIALAVVLFLLVVILNGGTILVGVVLTIFQVVISVVGIALAIGVSLWIFGSILKAIGGAEARIKKDLESLRKTFLRATYKSGADVLSLVTGLLAYLIQEAVADYPWPYKISICVLFTIDFFLASQLIGSEKRSDKTIGIIFFVSPVVLFSITVLALAPSQVVISWFHNRSIMEITLLSSVLVSTLLTFVFAFLKQREV